uniref:Uncharacterized protein n=1 Tax=Ditylenchus dipsaci TaxID=166011 RepID=A0A915DRI2_9BILA
MSVKLQSENISLNQEDSEIKKIVVVSNRPANCKPANGSSVFRLQQHNRLTSNSSLIGSTSNISGLRPQQSTENPSSSLIDYRSLVDLESYTSILPEDSISRIAMDRDNQSVGMRFKNGLESLWDDEDKNENSFSSSDTSSNFPTLNNENSLHTPATNGYFGKPTVQVHPIPALESSLSSSTSSISPPETFKKLPPPVPKKPNQIAKRVNQTNDSFSEGFANLWFDIFLGLAMGLQS